MARVAGGGTFLPGTVSTVNEAEYFARGGVKDLLFAQGFTLNKLPRVLAIERETGARITLITDDMGTLEALAAETRRQGARVALAIEIDSGEHRGGLRADDPLVVRLAQVADAAPSIDFLGVMTHAGHSYGTNDLAEVRRIAGRERDAAVFAAEAIRKAGVAVELVSVGSSPTVLHADHLRGVTEMRCGIYLFWDLSQLSRNVCRLDEIAMSVLTSVIGQNREQGYLLVDAGALAMSKDVGAHKYMPQAASVPLRCRDQRTAWRSRDCDRLSGARVVPVRDPVWFDRLPVGAMARVLPNHAASRLRRILATMWCAGQRSSGIGRVRTAGRDASSDRDRQRAGAGLDAVRALKACALMRARAQDTLKCAKLKPSPSSSMRRIWASMPSFSSLKCTCSRSG